MVSPPKRPRRRTAPVPEASTCWAQHLLAPRLQRGPYLTRMTFYEEVTLAPRRMLDSRRADFDDVERFVENGGYALQAAYERYRKNCSATARAGCQVRNTRSGSPGSTA